MSSLVYKTTCIYCGWNFTEQGLPDGDVDPRNIPAHVLAFNGKLTEHLQKGAKFEEAAFHKATNYHKKHGGPPPDPANYVHLRAFTEIPARIALAHGSAVMAAFDSQDPAFRQMKEMARLRLNTVTRKLYFTDEMILDAVVAIGLDPEDQKHVLDFCTQMRDALMEQGKFAPGQEGVTQVEAAARLVI